MFPSNTQAKASLLETSRRAIVAPARRSNRRGFTAFEAGIGGLILLILFAIATPSIYYFYRSMQKNVCQNNLYQMFVGIQDYHTNHAEAFPCGSRYQSSNDTPWGTSWWVDIFPHLDIGEEGKIRWQPMASSGKFDLHTGNVNVKLVDGVFPSVMQCPTSPLPFHNNPLVHLSVETRGTLKDRHAQGLAVPCYVAIAGSAPDMQGLKPNQPASGPRGRNTRDEKYGILSGSGAFPPNQPLKLSAFRDGMSHVIMLGEQSGLAVDDVGFSKQVELDLRSAWPDGAYTGTSGKYGVLRPEAKDVNGAGDQPCYNITTLRYRINSTVAFDVAKPPKGITFHHEGGYPPPPKDTPAKVPVKSPPGPGHNQGLFSAHGGGAFVIYVDGHTEFLSDETDPVVLQMLATRDDGNITP